MPVQGVTRAIALFRRSRRRRRLSPSTREIVRSLLSGQQTWMVSCRWVAPAHAGRDCRNGTGHAATGLEKKFGTMHRSAPLVLVRTVGHPGGVDPFGLPHRGSRTQADRAPWEVEAKFVSEGYPVFQVLRARNEWKFFAVLP